MFKTINVVQKIKKLEKDSDAFQQIIAEVETADGIIWSFGLFVLAAPAQLMRFIKLIWEKNLQLSFKEKYTAVITSSNHFYDHTAHNYIRGVCEDLGMYFVDSFSADILSIRNKDDMSALKNFIEDFFSAIKNKRFTSRLFNKLIYNEIEYKPTSASEKISTQNQKVLVLTDRYDPSTNLGKMIDRFRDSFSDKIELLSLTDIDIRGACIGCMRCGYNYECQYNDGFRDFYNNKVRNADIIVFGGEIKRRYLSSMWKTFYDRAFFWNPTPSLVGKQIAYLLSGPIESLG